MSIPSAMVVLAVSAGICVHATPTLFTPGDVYWISKTPMRMFEIGDGGSFASAAASITFPEAWNSAGSMVFAEDRSLGYATITSVSGGTTGTIVRFTPDGQYSTFLNVSPQMPTGIARIGDTIYYTSQTEGRLYRIQGNSSVLVASGLGSPRTLLAHDGYLLVTDATAQVIRKVTINPSTGAGTVTNAYTGLIRPMDIVVLGDYLYYTSNPTVEAKVTKIHLGTGQRSDHATGQPFMALALADGKLLAGNFQSSISSVWDITAGGDYSSAAAWAYGLPGHSDTMLAAVPGARPIPQPPITGMQPTPEPSTWFLMGAGILLIAARRFTA
jgi:hypothetical protein